MVSSSTEMWRSWVNGEIEGLFSLQEFHLTRWRLFTSQECVVKKSTQKYNTDKYGSMSHHDHSTVSSNLKGST